jgi:ribosome-associated protein
MLFGVSTDSEAIHLPQGVVIPLGELVFEFSRGGGPGGQNVNKVNSRVTLRFDVAGSECLAAAVRDRLMDGLKSRLTTEGELVMHAAEHREQARNRSAVIERFEALLTEILTPRKKRRPTKPTRGSKERRIKERKRRSQIKKWRRKPGQDD